ncbi:MAG: tetratricopeptide repeat protein [Anaerolineae bacterium]|nr:tetratricopeptide repeat protein [Anaerolineae bacterium]
MLPTSNALPSMEIIANRYVVREEVGRGAMGTVFRVEDRLLRGEVALKRLSFRDESFDRESATEMRVALTSEFRLLATLRHPHIVGVIDYGFDHARKPFFTMELFERAQTIVAACQGLPVADRLRLFGQMLQALHYIHRRGILHRDLKPANVLVCEGQVKVLDFGLSVDAREAHGIMGTLRYMAPEVLSAARGVDAPPFGPEIDIYAAGIIAYEMLSGMPDVRYPIAVDAFENLGLDPSLALTLSRMVAHDPAFRYDDAAQVLVELPQHIGDRALLETTAQRESFLMSSRFVGRVHELTTLKSALTHAAAGHGSAWLVIGESGVGKSRLLDELRVHALVEGALVARVHEAETSGSPFQAWREPLRRLLIALNKPLPEQIASFLKPLIPDLPGLLDRPVDDPPPLTGESAQRRLEDAILMTLDQISGPAVILVEDLHWSRESLGLLRKLSLMAADRPLLLVGSVRSDEPAAILDEPTGFTPLRLDRLSAAEVESLSESMIGAVGRKAGISELLLRETEGNVFFLVEVVRALAEESGALDQIGVKTLPERVLAGGIQQVIDRRLDRVPVRSRALMKAAAVVGRALDLPILTAMLRDETVTLETWLDDCANAAVIALADGRWQFSHDKLRERLLEGFDEDVSRSLNRRAAEAIEACYPDDGDWTAALARHWIGAHDRDKVRVVIERAVHQLMVLSQFHEVLRMIDGTQALLGPGDPLTARLSALQGDALRGLGDFAAAATAYEAAAPAAEGDPALRAELLNGMARVHWHRSEYDAAQQKAHESLALRRALQDREGAARALNLLGVVASRQGRYADAVASYQESLAVFREIDSPIGMSTALNNLGLIAFRQGDWTAARSRYEESLKIDQEIGDRYGQAACLNNLGGLAEMQGDYAEARARFEESLAIRRAIGDRYGVSQSLGNLADVQRYQGDLLGARRTTDEALALQRQTGDRYGESQSLHNLGLVTLFAGVEGGAEWFRAALALRQEIGDRRGSAESGILLGCDLLGWRIAVAWDHEEMTDSAPSDAYRAEACDLLREGLRLAAELKTAALVDLALIGFARLTALDGNLADAAALIGWVEADHQPGPEARALIERLREMIPTLPTAVDVPSAAWDSREEAITALIRDGGGACRGQGDATAP